MSFIWRCRFCVADGRVRGVGRCVFGFEEIYWLVLRDVAREAVVSCQFYFGGEGRCLRAYMA